MSGFVYKKPLDVAAVFSEIGVANFVNLIVDNCIATAEYYEQNSIKWPLPFCVYRVSDSEKIDPFFVLDYHFLLSIIGNVFDNEGPSRDFFTNDFRLISQDESVNTKYEIKRHNRSFSFLIHAILEDYFELVKHGGYTGKKKNEYVRNHYHRYLAKRKLEDGESVFIQTAGISFSKYLLRKIYTDSFVDDSKADDVFARKWYKFVMLFEESSTSFHFMKRDYFGEINERFAPLSFWKSNGKMARYFTLSKNGRMLYE